MGQAITRSRTCRPRRTHMTAEATGFQKFESTHNVLASNSTISIDAKLTLGEATQTVEVTATAALLQTQSAAVQSEITGQQIQKQELNGRNPIYMTQFLPGAVSTATLGDFNFAFNSGDAFNINGARTQDTLYTIDGAPAVRTRDDGEIIAGVKPRRGAGNASDSQPPTRRSTAVLPAPRFAL